MTVRIDVEMSNEVYVALMEALEHEIGDMNAMLEAGGWAPDEMHRMEREVLRLFEGYKIIDDAVNSWMDEEREVNAVLEANRDTQ